MILERSKQVAGVKTDKEFAEILGVSHQNFSARKKNKSLIPLIVTWALQSDVDLNWLLRGEDRGITDFQSYKISDLLGKTAQVLEHRDHISKALATCIEAHFLASKGI